MGQAPRGTIGAYWRPESPTDIELTVQGVLEVGVRDLGRGVAATFRVVEPSVAARARGAAQSVGVPAVLRRPRNTVVRRCTARPARASTALMAE